MSVKLMSLVWDNVPLSGSHLLTLLALADWANDQGGSLHPSMRVVADKVRVSEKQARRIVHDLESLGYVIVIGNKHGGAPGTTRQYRLDVRKLMTVTRERPPLEEMDTPPADGSPTTPTDVTPPVDVTPPAGVQDGSHGREGTPPAGVHGGLPPMGGNPSVNHQGTTSEPPGCGSQNSPVADAPGPHGSGSEDPETKFQAACRETWTMYSEAYERRYGVRPVRNAKVNTQVRGFVERLGHQESPLVAAWFVMHPHGYYVGRCHDFGALLADAEKLRTEWATGRLMTQGKAKQVDRVGTTASAVEEALARMKAGSGS